MSDSLMLVEQMKGVACEHGASEWEFHIGPVLSFDGATQQFTGAEAAAANKLLRREDRAGFEVREIEPNAAAAG